MRHVFRLGLTPLALLVFGSAARPEEPLPPPRVESPVFVRPSGYRPSRYAVWQFYDVDRAGRFRPLVIYSPYGSFYAATGEPFPWVQTHQRDFAPRIANAANFAEGLAPLPLADEPDYMPYAID